MIKGNVKLFCCFNAIFSLIEVESIVQENFCYYFALKMLKRRFDLISDAHTLFSSLLFVYAVSNS